MMSRERKQRILWKLAEQRVVRIEAGTGVLRALVADTPETLAQGLSGLDSLPSNTGMLFVMPREGAAHFWMRNTRVPLDIAFLDRNARVLSIQSMEPETGSALHDGPVKFALEVNAGWLSNKGVRIGDDLKIG